MWVHRLCDCERHGGDDAVEEEDELMFEVIFVAVEFRSTTAAGEHGHSGTASRS